MFIKCPYCDENIEIDYNDDEVICPNCNKKVIVSDEDRADAETEELFVIDEFIE